MGLDPDQSVELAEKGANAFVKCVLKRISHSRCLGRAHLDTPRDCLLVDL